MVRAFVGMGSNVDPETNLREAVMLLADSVTVLNLSTVLLTEPIGRPEQSAYFNCVAEIETELTARELKQNVLRSIEDRLGRKRGSDKYAARTIDLDLLLYGNAILHETGLEIPDPDIRVRAFLARGLAELSPALVLPGSGTKVSEIALRLNDPAIKPLVAYTALLKGELNHGPR